MATISENLQTLNEAKQAIKTAIENKGQDLTDVPFTRYAEKIEAIEQGESERSIKKYLEAGGDFRYSAIEDFRPLLDFNDTENLTKASSLFANATGVKYVPLLNFENITKDINYLHNNNKQLVELPLYNLRNCKGMAFCFSGCTTLTKIPAIDCRSVNNFLNPFQGSVNLTEIWIKNIKHGIQVASGDTYGHLLTVESLIHLIKELRDTGSLKTLTVGNVNLEKLANIYVRTIEITDEMQAEDDLIDEKLPFEVCESTDEGAMLITDYVAFKNWTIA